MKNTKWEVGLWVQFSCGNCGHQITKSILCTIYTLRSTLFVGCHRCKEEILRIKFLPVLELTRNERLHAQTRIYLDQFRLVELTD